MNKTTVRYIAAAGMVVVSILTSCKHSPITNPSATNAQANMDQAKYLDSIYIQLKRIADNLDKTQLK